MQNIAVNVENELLSKYAENEAKGLAVSGETSFRKVIRLTREQVDMIQKTALKISGWSPERSLLPQEFEWLLDNRYLLEREGKDVCLTLKKAGRAPRCEGLPAIYRLAASLARAGRNRVTGERIELFLKGAQSARALNEKELWLFVPMLKAALVAAAAGLCRELLEVLDGYERKGDKNPFAAELTVRRALEEGSAPPESAEELAQLAEKVHTRLSQSLGQAVTSLRLLSGADFTELLKDACVIEKSLAQDPVYTQMSDASRARYRAELSRMAKREGLSEPAAARKVLELSRAAGDARRKHVGYYIFEQPLGKPRGKAAGRLYFFGLIALSLLFPGIAVWLSGAWWVGALLLLPLAELSKNLMDFVVLRLVKPRYMPRLELPDGLPARAATLCVISTLLTNEKKAKVYADMLERYSVTNRDAGKHLSFGLLVDLPDADAPVLETDRTVLEAAKKAIEALNAQHGGGFYLFVRPRTLHERDNRFMGWERKRGALCELARLLKGEEASLRAAVGEPAPLKKIKYVITLDADTHLNAGAAREMVGAMLHPLVKPVVDPEKRVVTEGHALLQPRMAVHLEAASRSLFSRVFAGQGGLDPYGGSVSDIYQDLFDRGSFIGKGIFEVDAFHACLDGRFPENRVLSHDLLEGEILRAGLLGDIELTDGYPSRAKSFFERLHRWTRGDWQAAAWMLPRVPGAKAKEKNPLGGLSKFKIFDNLRRSLSPFCLLLALTMGLILSGPVFWWASGAALLVALSPLLLSAGEMAFRGGGGQRYHSTIITGLAAVVWQTGLQLLFLPYTALLSLHAAVVALYRVVVSRRRLLQWVTSDQAEQAGKDGPGRSFLRMWPAVLWGVGCMALSPAGLAVGLLWAFSPLAAWRVSLPESRKRDIPGEDRAFLMRQASLIWQYFADFLTPEDHFLPPDNWQEQPAAGVAHRTSPTNIGMALLCALAAIDLQLVGADQALRLIDRILSTVEGLPKWHGHIYNWIDTKTLRPLHPRYVSTVDSGNFAGSLITLREGLLELRDAAAEDLAARADKLARNMLFWPLYDAKRHLFYIGQDLDSGKPTDGYYDLLASEARQTSYLAIARGEIERRHWRRLGRALVTDGQYSGMASWTGTMFEYMMPQLLMPTYENSLLYESARFCVRCHQKRTVREHVPWGISESCFYSFDNALNYQYKAHGVSRLAFKRGLGKETVVSPYSSFLALGVAPRAAVKNLRALRNLGLEGKYGFYEAADFTPARQTGQLGFEPVRCFMSHHLGMSLLSIDNLLRDGVMPRRFMRDREMGAFAELLQERVPVGAISMRNVGREVPEKPARMPVGGLRREGGEARTGFPVCHLLSNASYTLFCTDGGLNASACSGLSLTRFERRMTGGAGGLRFLIGDGESYRYLTPAPEWRRDIEYSYLFESGAARWESEGQGLSVALTARVPDNEMAEWRAVTLKNTGAEVKKLTLACYFEPVLGKEEDFEAHPAFSKLFLQTGIEGQTVMVHRRPRAGKGDAYLAFTCDHPAVGYDTSREAALGRGGEDSLPACLSVAPGFTQGAVLDPCVLARVPIVLQPGQSVTVRFALSAAAVAHDARAAAVRTVNMPAADAGPGRMDGILRLLGLTADEAIGAYEMLRELMFPVCDKTGAYTRENNMGQPGLWKFGVSGDLPIMLFKCFDLKAQEKLARVIRQHRLLGLSGAGADLVVLTHDGSDYRRPVRGVIMETLKAIGGETLLGVRGGVHVVDVTACPEEEQTLLGACADWIYEGDTDKEPPRVAVLPPAFRRDHTRPLETEGRPVTRYLADGAFQFDTAQGLPRAAWSHLLANPAFGALCTDAGTGHLWRLNARENNLTPWKNDPLAVRGGEEIFLCADGREVSLFADTDGHPVTVTYGFGYARWEKKVDHIKVETLAFVPPDRMARVLTVKVEGASDAYLKYRSAVWMGATEIMRRHVSMEREPGGLILARNGYNTAFNPQVYAVGTKPAATDVQLSRGEVFFKQPLKLADKAFSGVLINGCAANKAGLALLKELLETPVIGDAWERTLSYWRKKVCPLRVDTPDEQLNRYLSGWALYQVLAGRMFARASLYQCGGAFGFRDQLQDSCALVYGAPERMKWQILRACAHQFEEGDVQHWWHPAGASSLGDRGVRTKCSDDLLWLPYALCEYLDKTGDEGVLAPKIPYLSSPPLGPDEDDRFETPGRSAVRENAYAHSVRALDRVIERGVGAHGLLLIGAGDWNDGFNMVGEKGRGESTWLTFFAAHTLERFSVLCRKQGEPQRADHYRRWAESLLEAAGKAWDGAWFLRGYYDDGDTLGASGDEECKIDSIAQSFSALVPQTLGGLSALERDNRIDRALDSAVNRLVDKENKVIRLFEPAFEKSPKNPGYIKGYVAGVRENGGQYTHAAVWLCMAFFLRGRAEEGYEQLRMLLPGTHDQEIYRVEPHVLAADVYFNPAHIGRGGWSIYTGAAAWSYRVAVEHFLGVRWKNGFQGATPRLPEDWRRFGLQLPDGGRLSVERDGSLSENDEKGFSFEEKYSIMTPD